MNKKIVSLAIAAALAAPMAASADATVYGKLRQSVETVKSEDNTPGAPSTNDTEEWNITSRGSRVGVKGSEDLGNGLKAVYKAEFQISMDGDEVAGGAGLNGTRNTFVGLAGNFGTVVLGTHDTPLKISTGALDYFDGTAAENDSRVAGMCASENCLSVLNAGTDRRAANTIAYISPSFAGLTIAAAIVPGEDSDGENGADTEANGLTDIYSIAAMYSNAGIYASVAREFASADTDTMTSVVAAPNNEDLVQTRLALGYSMDNWGVNVQHETIVVDDIVDQTSLAVAGKVGFGNSHVAAKWFSVEEDEKVAGADAELSYTGWAVKFGHSLSKRTSVSVTHVSTTGDDNTNDASVTGLNVVHNF